MIERKIDLLAKVLMVQNYPKIPEIYSYPHVYTAKFLDTEYLLGILPIVLKDVGTVTLKAKAFIC